MKLSLMGRIALAALASVALGLGMSACGGGTIGYMWVLGDQFNQITGYKIDEFSGNLTQVIGSPFSSNGVNPVSIVVKPGGRYVYVINQGSGGGIVTDPNTGKTKTVKETSGGVSVYSVGGDGVLTYQQSYATQGSVPTWAQFDGGGTFLYVLDKYAGTLDSAGNADTVGAITAFSVDGSTGRLTLIQNTGQLSNNLPTNNFKVGPLPIMMKSSGGCLFTLDTGNQTVFPYSFGSGGQLTLTTPGSIPTQASGLTSINGSGSNIYLTDGAANKILPYTVGGSCNLTSATGGVVNNLSGASNPVYSFVDNAGKFLYVLNGATVNTGGGTTTPYSSVSAFVISPQLTPIPDSPYKTGSNPVCMVEDPTSQYVYISNRNDGTVTGQIIDPTTGRLRDLTRGSTFPASGLGSCLAVSGAVN